jgi:DNA-directed RNA polymerase subunit RPC12/RpoP
MRVIIGTDRLTVICEHNSSGFGELVLTRLLYFQSSWTKSPAAAWRRTERLPGSAALFKCSICGKELSSRTGLRSHEDAHRGVFRYSCAECGRGFHSHSHLRGHMATHTHVREFHCPHCGKEYAYSGDCSRHVNSCPANPSVIANISAQTIANDNTSIVVSNSDVTDNASATIAATLAAILPTTNKEIMGTSQPENSPPEHLQK